MFKLSIEDRLSYWIELRKQLEDSENPLQDVWDFWHQAPFIPHNKNIDPYHKKSWPSPWEIIAENKYDDFTRALMIGYTLKLTKKFQNSKIELKTLLDNIRPREYNVVYIDESWALNYDDEGPIPIESIDTSFLIENLIEVTAPR
jgi:DNA-directed RNA polymerase